MEAELDLFNHVAKFQLKMQQVKIHHHNLVKKII